MYAEIMKILSIYYSFLCRAVKGRVPQDFRSPWFFLRQTRTYIRDNRGFIFLNLSWRFKNFLQDCLVLQTPESHYYEKLENHRGVVMKLLLNFKPTSLPLKGQSDSVETIC